MPPSSGQSAMCRVCLAPARLLPLFAREQSSIQFAEVILIHSGVKVEENDGFPQGICFACSQLLKSAAFLRKLARASDEKLRLRADRLENATIKGEVDGESPKTNAKSDRRRRLTCESDGDSTNGLTNSIKLEDSPNNSESEDPEDDKKLIELVTTHKSKTEAGNKATEDRDTCVADSTVKEESNQNESDEDWSGRVRAVYRVAGAPGALVIECRVCGVRLKQRSSMPVHAQKHLGYRVICEACGKGFPNNCALQQHKMNRHGHKKAFACKQCSFTSSVKFELTVHERTHTGERPFVCDTCGSSFYRRRCLIVHTRSHSETRPHKCTSCEKRFVSRSDMLAHHNAVHQRRYVFPCPLCAHTYARRATVYKHAAAAHRAALHRGQLTKVML